MLNKTSKILLTVSIGGELGSPLSYKSNAEEISKVHSSPYEDIVKDSKGFSTGMYFTPKDHFTASNNFRPRTVQNCTRNLNINGDAIMYFISNECPQGIKKHIWLSASQDTRIKYHLNQLAEGLPYTFEIIE